MNSVRNSEKNNELRERVAIFNKPTSGADEVAATVEYFLVAAYDGSTDDSLDMLSHRRYKQTFAKQPVTATFELACLLQESAAAKRHSLRVFHPVQQWMGVNLDASELGWKMVDGRL